MKILVLGGRGMLGREVVSESEKRGHETFYGDYDVVYSVGLHAAAQQVKPDAVINCAGVVPAKSRDNVRMLLVNTIGPHNVAKWLPDAHIIQVSTDCVFSGLTKGPHKVTDLPDPDSLYGRSKLAGELTGPSHTTVRTSFIGYDHGLLPWLMSASGTVGGWVYTFWSGSTVYEVARQLISIAEGGPAGLVHLASAPISKYRLLRLLCDALGLCIDVTAARKPDLDRSLSPTVRMPGVADVLDELVRHRS